MPPSTLHYGLIYARAYDATVEADYYAAMSRVEQRLALVDEPEEGIGRRVGENERFELLKLADQLAEPELSNELRLDLVLLMRALLNGNNLAQRVDRESVPGTKMLDHPPPAQILVDADIA